ncbi:hypothetical protein B0H13DRAFT_1863674 [Mycena leptocephala]|nr:hypothetical protein B0H13DRAFT_1863674 [Mycena leptocephala]
MARKTATREKVGEKAPPPQCPNSFLFLSALPAMARGNKKSISDETKRHVIHMFHNRKSKQADIARDLRALPSTVDRKTLPATSRQHMATHIKDRTQDEKKKPIPLEPAPPRSPSTRDTYAQKVVDGVFQLPPRPDPPRDSPLNRKTGLKISTDRIDRIYTRDAANGAESPTPGANVPLPSATPSLDSPSSSSSPATSPTIHTMEVDHQKPVTTSLHPSSLHSSNLNPSSSRPCPRPRRPPPPPAPTIPTHDELMALVPHGRADNPHRGRQPSQQTPPTLANGCPPFQRNVGDWALPVFAVQRLLENVDPTVASVVTAAHQEFLALPIFNGGQRALTVYKMLLNDVARALSVFAGPDDMVITRPQPLVVQTREWSKKYMAPFCLFIQFLDPLIRAQVLAQGTYAINRDLGFHAVPIDLAFISWVVRLWNPVASTVSVITLIKQIRFALLLFMVNNPAVVHCIGQMTQGILVGTAAERTLAVAKSADAQFIPHPTDPMIVVYLQPPTTDEAAFEDLKALIRPRTLSYQMSSFAPQSATRTSPTSAPSPTETSRPAPPPTSGGAPPTKFPNYPRTLSSQPPRPTVTTDADEALEGAGPTAGTGEGADAPEVDAGARGARRGHHHHLLVAAAYPAATIAIPHLAVHVPP